MTVEMQDVAAEMTATSALIVCAESVVILMKQIPSVRTHVLPACSMHHSQAQHPLILVCVMMTSSLMKLLILVLRVIHYVIGVMTMIRSRARNAIQTRFSRKTLKLA